MTKNIQELKHENILLQQKIAKLEQANIKACAERDAMRVIARIGKTASEDAAALQDRIFELEDLLKQKDETIQQLQAENAQLTSRSTSLTLLQRQLNNGHNIATVWDETKHTWSINHN